MDTKASMIEQPMFRNHLTKMQVISQHLDSVRTVKSARDGV